jgi:predicted RNA-binding protein YlqC (UPF0109 family)
MKAFLEFVAKALVDHPEEVICKELDGERAIVFELHLNPADVGKVIGKSGRTITAIRMLMTSVAAKSGKRAMVEIIEPAGQRATGAAAPAEGADESGPSPE